MSKKSLMLIMLLLAAPCAAALLGPGGQEKPAKLQVGGCRTSAIGTSTHGGISYKMPAEGSGLGYD